MSIGENVRARRGAMPRKTLAETSGVSRQTIAVIEQGVTAKPHKRTLAALAGALDCTVTDLTGNGQLPGASKGNPPEDEALSGLADVAVYRRPDRRPPMVAETEQERYLLTEFRYMPLEAQRNLLVALSGHNSAEFSARAEKRRGRMM